MQGAKRAREADLLADTPMELASIIAIIAGAAVLIALLVYLLKPKTESLFSARITQPLTVSAVIFSLDEGGTSWSALLTLIASLREKGFHIALATSASRSEFESKMSELPSILEAMDAIVTGNEVSKPKPSADLFIEAARRLRVDPTRCLVFDESPAGIEGAQLAGMFTAAVGPSLGGFAARFGALQPEWMLSSVAAFDVREIERPKNEVMPDLETIEESPLVALARLLPPGSALQKCLAGDMRYDGYGV